jgi:molybdopterin-guanine dinucleotide biosynthesis protein A
MFGARVIAILLAGGESSAWYSQAPADWGSQTLIEYQVSQLREAGAGA